MKLEMIPKSYPLSSGLYSLIAHALGVKSTDNKIPRSFTRNKLVLEDGGEYEKNLNELLEKKYMNRSRPIEMYGNSRIYQVTDLGKRIFTKQWKETKSNHSYAYNDDESSITISERQYNAVNMLLGIYRELAVVEEFMWSLSTKGKTKPIILEIDTNHHAPKTLIFEINKTGVISKSEFKYIGSEDNEPNTPISYH